MIRRLRRKLIGVVMLSLTVILIIVVGAINIVSYRQITAQADRVLDILQENQGKFPDKLPQPPQDDAGKPPYAGNHDFITEDTPFESRYFVVNVNTSGEISQLDTGHIASISAGDAKSYGEEVLQAGKTSGYCDSYRYRISDTDNGKQIIFLYRYSELHTVGSQLAASLAVAVAVLVAMFLLVALLSRRIVRPMEENMEKQKQFVTDASHELKTPLAIISANAEVLEMIEGKSEWTESIRNQIGRMSELVQNLVTLSRMEEENIHTVFTDFSLSDAVSETAEPFGTLAESKGLQIQTEIAGQITFCGDEKSIRQMISILLDNAVKYAVKDNEAEQKEKNADRRIFVSLSRQGNYAILAVSNAVEEMPEKPERLFDRFYRADESRTRESGGYGIGLAVARAAAEAHKGKITAEKESEHRIAFQVRLPLK